VNAADMNNQFYIQGYVDLYCTYAVVSRKRQEKEAIWKETES